MISIVLVHGIKLFYDGIDGKIHNNLLLLAIQNRQRFFFEIDNV